MSKVIDFKAAKRAKKMQDYKAILTLILDVLFLLSWVILMMWGSR